MKTHKIEVRTGEVWSVQIHVDGRLQIVDDKGRQRHYSKDQATTGVHLAMQLAKQQFRSAPNADAALVMAANQFEIGDADGETVL